MHFMHIWKWRKNNTYTCIQSYTIKNFEKNDKNYGKFSSLYEEIIRDISLDDYVELYAGLTIQDNL